MKQIKLLIALSLSFIFTNANADGLPIASISKQTSQASYEKIVSEFKNSQDSYIKSMLNDIGKEIIKKSEKGYFTLEYKLSFFNSHYVDNELLKNLLLNSLVSELIKSGYKAQIISSNNGNYTIKIDWN